MDAKLFKAIEDKNYSQIESLIAEGADLAQENKDKQTPIQFASTIDIKCVKTIAKSKKTDKEDSYRYGSALLDACRNGHSEIATCLLNAGAPTAWYSTSNKYNPLHWLIKNHTTKLDNTEIVKLILKNDNDSDLAHQNTDGQTPLQVAGDLGHWTIVEAIAQLKNLKNDTYNAGSVLITTVRQNRLETTRALLKAQSPSSWHTIKDKNTCMHWAVINNNMPMVALLLEYGASTAKINLEGQTPFELACAKGYWGCALLILQNKLFFINDHSKAGLAYIDAVQAGQLEIAGLLHKAGASTSGKTSKEGNTALHCLALHWDKLKNNNQALNFVLKHGANLQTVSNYEDKTPIEVASEHGFWDCVQCLIEYNQEILKDKIQTNKIIQDYHLEKVFINAIKSGNYFITKLLLDHGVPNNSQNSDMGNISLYWAVTADKPDIVKLLLKRGANPDIKNKEAKTTHHLAQQLDRKTCLMHLNRSNISNEMYIDLDFLKELRQKAYKQFQLITDDAVKPVDLPGLIKKLNTLHLQILTGDKNLLMEEREKLQANTPLQRNLFFQSNNNVTPDKLNTLIKWINNLLQQPSQSLQLNVELNLNALEELDIHNYLSYKQHVDCYEKKISLFLVDIEKAIQNTKWKTSFWGTVLKPEPIKQIEKELNCYIEKPTGDVTLTVYENIINLLNDLENIDETNKLYIKFSSKIASMTFWSETKSTAKLPNNPIINTNSLVLETTLTTMSPNSSSINSKNTYQPLMQSKQDANHFEPVYDDNGRINLMSLT